MEDEPEKYQSHFSEYIKRGIEPDNMEELYKKVHAAIRADPTAKKSEKQLPKEHKRCDFPLNPPSIAQTLGKNVLLVLIMIPNLKYPWVFFFVCLLGDL